MNGVAQTATRICNAIFNQRIFFNQDNCQSRIPCTFSLLFDIFFAVVAVAFAVCRKSISFQIYLAQDVERGLLCGTAQGEGGEGGGQKGRTNTKLIKMAAKAAGAIAGSKRRKVCNVMSSVSHKYEQ